MHESNQEIRGGQHAPDRLLSAARELAASAGDGAGAVAGRKDGEAIVRILEPMGLPADVLAATLLYPLCRTGDIDEKDIEKDSFVDETVKLFKSAEPLMKFLCDALGVPF